MRGHLAAVGVWILSCANGGKQLFKRRHAELEAERAIAVIGIKPIIARLQSHAGRDQDCFMAGAADLKENLVLVLELDFLVVEPAREIHGAIHFEHLFARETRTFTALSTPALFALSALLGSAR